MHYRLSKWRMIDCRPLLLIGVGNQHLSVTDAHSIILCNAQSGTVRVISGRGWETESSYRFTDLFVDGQVTLLQDIVQCSYVTRQADILNILGRRNWRTGSSYWCDPSWTATNRLLQPLFIELRSPIGFSIGRRDGVLHRNGRELCRVARRHARWDALNKVIWVPGNKYGD